MQFLKPHLLYKKLNVITVMVIIFPLLFRVGFASAQIPTEEQVKTVFIYNFVHFVEWPSSVFKQTSEPFVIGVIGGDGYLTLLREVVKGETYKGRSIEVRNVVTTERLDECNILFLDKTSLMIDKILAEVKGLPILTIADKDGFIEKGGIIRFYIEDGKVKMEINQKLAQERQLLISSKILRLSKLYEN